MRVTQGTFSFLDDLTDSEIEAQIAYALSNDWAIMVEYTDDPHPRNSFWEMWKQPEFDLEPGEADVAMRDVAACREAYPNHYVKVVAYDSSLGRQTSALSFMVNRPAEEPGFRLERQDKADRQMRYTVVPYAHWAGPARAPRPSSREWPGAADHPGRGRRLRRGQDDHHPRPGADPRRGSGHPRLHRRLPPL